MNPFDYSQAFEEAELLQILLKQLQKLWNWNTVKVEAFLLTKKIFCFLQDKDYCSCGWWP